LQLSRQNAQPNLRAFLNLLAWHVDNPTLRRASRQIWRTICRERPSNASVTSTERPAGAAKD